MLFLTDGTIYGHGLHMISNYKQSGIAESASPKFRAKCARSLSFVKTGSGNDTILEQRSSNTSSWQRVVISFLLLRLMETSRILFSCLLSFFMLGCLLSSVCLICLPCCRRSCCDWGKNIIKMKYCLPS